MLYNNLLIDELKSRNSKVADEVLRDLCEKGEPDAYIKFGMIMSYHGNPDEKKESKKILLKWCNKNESDACFWAGELIYDEGNKSKAKGLYKKGCKLKHDLSCHNYAFMLKESGKIKEARKYYKQACNLHPIEGCFYYGQFEEWQGNIKIALEAYLISCNNCRQQGCNAYDRLKKGIVDIVLSKDQVIKMAMKKYPYCTIFQPTNQDSKEFISPDFKFDGMDEYAFLVKCKVDNKNILELIILQKLGGKNFKWHLFVILDHKKDYKISLDSTYIGEPINKTGVRVEVEKEKYLFYYFEEDVVKVFKGVVPSIPAKR